MLFYLSTHTVLLLQDATSWATRERDQFTRDEDGMSETIQNVLWAIAAIAAVAIVWAVIQNYLQTKAAEIR